LLFNGLLLLKMYVEHTKRQDKTFFLSRNAFIFPYVYHRSLLFAPSFLHPSTLPCISEWWSLTRIINANNISWPVLVLSKHFSFLGGRKCRKIFSLLRLSSYILEDKRKNWGKRASPNVKQWWRKEDFSLSKLSAPGSPRVSLLVWVGGG